MYSTLIFFFQECSSNLNQQNRLSQVSMDYFFGKILLQREFMMEMEVVWPFPNWQKTPSTGQELHGRDKPPNCIYSCSVTWGCLDSIGMALVCSEGTWLGQCQCSCSQHQAVQTSPLDAVIWRLHNGLYGMSATTIACALGTQVALLHLPYFSCRTWTDHWWMAYQWRQAVLCQHW